MLMLNTFLSMEERSTSQWKKKKGFQTEDAENSERVNMTLGSLGANLILAVITILSEVLHN